MTKQIVNCQICGFAFAIKYGTKKHWICHRCIEELAEDLDWQKLHNLYLKKRPKKDD
jgi:ribosomal protein L37AE/L43A